jgi:hypothetical protein
LQKYGIKAACFRTFDLPEYADDSYDFSDIMPFVNKLRKGFDLAMGNRFIGEIKKGAMPLLHRYFGNPILTRVGKLFFNSPVGDFHCGLRGISREAFQKMCLQTTGMEFASEMVVKATFLGLRIAEVPISLSPDGRSRRPHLRSWRDGWRHLRFMLLYSPRWLFFYPGAVMFVDVLHHTDDPMILLREAVRVARKTILIKDHTLKGILAEPTLRFMDLIGNARYNVKLPYNYWSESKWRDTFKTLSMNIVHWKSKLNLYYPPARWFFDRSLHFIAKLEFSNDPMNEVEKTGKK